MVRLIQVAEPHVVIDQHRQRVFFHPTRVTELSNEWKVSEFSPQGDESGAVLWRETKSTRELHQHGAKLLRFLDRANPLTESGNVLGLKLNIVSQLLPQADAELEVFVRTHLPAPQLT